MKAHSRRSGYSLVMVLIVLLIGGSFVALAFQIVESRNRLGTMSIAQMEKYNAGISLLEDAKFWIHNTIELTGKLPVRTSASVPVNVSDLLIRSSDGYAIYDLAYPPLGTTMDESLVGFPRWELSSFSGSISIGDYSPASHVEGPDQIGIYLIRTFPSEGGGYEVVVTEGL